MTMTNTGAASGGGKGGLMGRLERKPGPEESPADPRILKSPEFRSIAASGFGDPQNSYPHAMAWFRDHLYVGTTRNVLHLVSIAPDPSTDAFHCWPVRVRPGTDATTLEQGCQIWRYDATAGEWAKTFQSPRLEHDGNSVWRDFGYRNMVVVRTRSDTAPALYVTTMSSSKGQGAHILRSEDGRDFHPVCAPGMGDAGVSSFRALVAFRNKLYTAPAGKGKLWAYSSSPVVLECADPLKGKWRPVSEPGFGDPDDLTIFELAVFDDHLYAGTGNAVDGFHVWKTDARGKPPYRWTKVITAGAYRGRLNEVVMSMGVFGGALYVGGGVRRGGFDREYKVGPAAAELIRIHPDGTWDLVAGTPRLTPVGAKKPLSGLGPGFGNPFTGYLWSMAEHDGILYLGTYDSSVFLSYVDIEKVPQRKRWLLTKLGVENIVAREGGFDLWGSADGAAWSRVSRTGFGNPYNYGVRTMAGTPHGLFVGAANPFAPEVAMKTPTGWSYLPNPRGGLEIWLGHRTTPPAAPSSGPAGETPQGALAAAVNVHYDNTMYSDINAAYYEGSDFANLGYWRKDTRSQVKACETLMEKLLAGIPGKKGTILDVACGKGATTRHLLKHYPPEAVTGINISDKQLETCRRNAPGCTFLVMNATALQFADATFDNIICVEAAFHFNTREAFLREALRVLKPGGRIVLSDILSQRRIERSHKLRFEANYLRDLAAYRKLLVRVGFEDLKVIDVTPQVWEGFNLNVARYATRKMIEGEVDSGAYKMALGRLVLGFPVVDYYLLAWAQKGHANTNDVLKPPGSNPGQ